MSKPTRYLLALCTTLLLPICVHAQATDSLTVRVTDKDTQEPLSQVEVNLAVVGGEDVGSRTTNGDGFVGFNLDPVSDVALAGGGSAAMYRAYPNPFTRSALVPFSIDRSATVSTQVYSLLGTQVASHREEIDRGVHAVDLSLPGLPAGTYVVRIDVDGISLGAVTLAYTGGGSGVKGIEFVRNVALPSGVGPLPFAKAALPGTTYRVTVSVEGYEPFEKDIAVAGHMNVDAALTPIPDPDPVKVPEFGTDETRKLTMIGNASRDSLDLPRDLDFNPLRPNELWTVNRAYDGTVIFFNAGAPNQRSEKRVDVYGYHFMEEVSAMAFGANETFATIHESNNTYNNTYPGNDFMGPALWSSSLEIYARVNQTNDLLGSHIDMLHETPFGMGIAHDRDNVYWVFDGAYGDIVRYDFGPDHGPGYDDHSDGVVRRYAGLSVKRVPDVPSHLDLDKTTGWLYINDTGNKRVMRLNTKTGQPTSNLQIVMEPLREYTLVTGAKVEVFADEDLVRPSGIAVYKGRVFVTDHATGEIIAYSAEDGTELGRISTGAKAIMGITVGPDGKLWYVDAGDNKVIRVDP